MLLRISAGSGGGRGKRREWHMSAADALGTESKAESYRHKQHLADTREEERTTGRYSSSLSHTPVKLLLSPRCTLGDGRVEP